MGKPVVVECSKCGAYFASRCGCGGCVKLTNYCGHCDPLRPRRARGPRGPAQRQHKQTTCGRKGCDNPSSLGWCEFCRDKYYAPFRRLSVAAKRLGVDFHDLLNAVRRAGAKSDRVKGGRAAQRSAFEQALKGELARLARLGLKHRPSAA